MHIALPVIALIAALALPAHAQSLATGVARDAAHGAKTARLSADALCAQLTLDEVTAIMGKSFERRPDKLFIEFKYGDSKDRQKVRFFSLGSSILKEAGWRKMMESGGKGKVTERDGMLVSHSRGNKFGALDEVWFKDRQDHVLYLRANSKITEDQAVALAKAAMD